MFHKIFRPQVFYILAVLLSMFGQAHGAFRWLEVPPEWPTWSKLVLIILTVMFLDLGFLITASDMAVKRQAGERALLNIAGMVLTAGLGIGISFAGHWSAAFGDRMMAIVFAGAGLVGIFIFLIVTPLSEQEDKVRHRNTERALVAHIKKVYNLSPTELSLVLQSMNRSKITDDLVSGMPNDKVATMLAERLNPANWDTREVSEVEPQGTEPVVETPQVEDIEPLPEAHEMQAMMVANQAAKANVVISEISDILSMTRSEIRDAIDAELVKLYEGSEDAPTSQRDIVNRIPGATEPTVSRRAKIVRKRLEDESDN